MKMDQARPSSSNSKTADLDAPLHLIGFQIDLLSPIRVTGQLEVTQKCCQPFEVLHEGVSALIAEALASIGAHMACGFKRIAGVQLSINHLKAAQLGDIVLAEARPISVGKTIQVWEVTLWRTRSGEEEDQRRVLMASSRVTLLVNLPVADDLRQAGESLKRHAKL